MPCLPVDQLWLCCGLRGGLFTRRDDSVGNVNGRLEQLCMVLAGDFKFLLVRSGQMHCRGDFLKVGGKTQVS